MRSFKTLAAWLCVAIVGSFAGTQAYAQCGVASYYWQGKITANGERYNANGISAAHRTLPFGSRVQVRNQRTGRTIVVRINDRGPFIRGRIIDLSRGAQRVFGMGGLANVCLTVLSRGNGRYVGNTGGRRKVASRSYAKRVAARLGGRKVASRITGRKLAARAAARKRVAAVRRARLSALGESRRLRSGS